MSAMCDNQNFDSSDMNSVNSLDIKKLLEYFAKNTYGAKAEDNEVRHLSSLCLLVT